MSDLPSTGRVVRFGVFEADLATGELRKSGVRVKLEQQPFQVLKVLLQRPGDLVTREELRDEVWSDDTFVDFDQSLNTAIRKLRDTLGDSATHPHFIETLPRRGYRFVGSVRGMSSTAGGRRDEKIAALKPRFKLRWSMRAAGVALALVVTAFAAVLLWNSSDRQRSDSVRRVTPLTSFVGPEWWPSWSPDGSFISFSHVQGGSLQIFVMPSAGGEPVRVTDSPADDFVSRWSPDGSRLAYLSDEGRGKNVYLVPPLGGPRTKLVETKIPWLARFVDSWRALGTNPWSPDGKELLFSRLQPHGRIALWKVQVDAGEETQLTDPPPDNEDFQASWSFDGESIVFMRRRGITGGLWLLTAGSREPQPLLVDEFHNTYPAWSPDNRRVAFDSNRAGAMNVWEITLSSGALKQITTGPEMHGGPTISSKGKLAYAQGSQQQDLYLRELATGTERRLPRHTGRNYFPRLSPSGNIVAYQSNRTGNFDIWVLDLTTGKERQLARHPAEDNVPDWSPDGSQLVFVSDRDGEPKMWLAALAGGPARKLSDRVVPVGSAQGGSAQRPGGHPTGD